MIVSPLILVQAVPWDRQRAVNAAHLRNTLGAEVVWDKTQNGFDTYLAVLQQATYLFSSVGFGPEEADALILEDDVTVTSDFLLKALRVITEHPGMVINFFNYRLHTSGRRDGAYYTSNACHYLPPGVPLSILTYAPEWNRTRHWSKPDQDMLVRDWLFAHKQDYWLHTPSLVQHNSWPSATSSQRSLNRRSPTFEP